MCVFGRRWRGWRELWSGGKVKKQPKVRLKLKGDFWQLAEMSQNERTEAQAGA